MRHSMNDPKGQPSSSRGCQKLSQKSKFILDRGTICYVFETFETVSSTHGKCCVEIPNSWGPWWGFPMTFRPWATPPGSFIKDYGLRSVPRVSPMATVGSLLWSSKSHFSPNSGTYLTTEARHLPVSQSAFGNRTTILTFSIDISFEFFSRSTRNVSHTGIFSVTLF
ncbi:hypothetical protein Desti_1729 [Desulfomonile tiedjei DSM 6799]|uniref:Uncharacterized protein n=1 Tax=Desulfomonile tiedjei (strain ATCC 49306 / DSM 6799 / DCB-1) TaxID=706587 RepID=I4C4E8_DESTA|nr:hypothetical protein Desti_1729 [Desulfomonile tiedjei DSM 6799]